MSYYSSMSFNYDSCLSLSGEIDAATGLYYYNARWYDAQTGRFITEDPARDGQNWYTYVSNNPLRFIDPTGMRRVDGDSADDERDRDQRESDQKTKRKRDREGAEKEINKIDPDAPLNQDEQISKAAKEKLGEPYLAGKNDCDIWGRDVLRNGGVPDEKNPIKNPEGTTVDGHQKQLGEGQSSPSDGTNVHIKDGHLSIVQKNGDTYTVYHQGRNRESITTSDGIETKQYSASYTYNSNERFEKSYWGTGSYYPVK